jgi:hypothetical protein
MFERSSPSCNFGPKDQAALKVIFIRCFLIDLGEVLIGQLKIAREERGDAFPELMAVVKSSACLGWILSNLEGSGIHVAEYLTVLPPREVLEARLQQALEVARERLENKSLA